MVLVVVVVVVVVVATYIQSLQDERIKLETVINDAVTLDGECCWWCCCGGGGSGGGSGGGGHLHTEPLGREDQAGDRHQRCCNTRWGMLLVLRWWWWW